jgi:starch synthase
VSEEKNTTTPNKKTVWVFCFEYAGIAKVGGLGEVSANQCRSIVKDPSLNLQVFMPSHNKHRDLQEKLSLSPIKMANGEKLLLKGHFDPAFFGLNHGDRLHSLSFTKFQSFTDVGYFEVEVWKGVLNNVPIHLLVGANAISSAILNDAEVYGTSTLNAKLGLFSWAMREYMRYCIFQDQTLIPDVIHIHDHHPVAALLCCRQELNKVGRDLKSIITMHLLTWPRRELEFFWKSGVNNEPMWISIPNKQMKTMSEVYEICIGDSLEAPTLEKVGCVLADKIFAVSNTFLHSDIIPNCGGDLIARKSDFTWNGCDWDYEKNKQTVLDLHRDSFLNFDVKTISSWEMRKSLLENILGNLPSNEPKISSQELRDVIAQEFNCQPYKLNCRVDSFDSDGPLVLITGRVSPQKGVENIFNAIPHVIEQIPDVKFLFLMVPTPYTIEDLKNYMVFARQYPDNVRFIFGIAGSIYLLAHLAADVYCCPSRWEPFGIVALEAMASKIPVVATYVGGLKESIKHLETYPEDGTGLLCPNNDGEALKNALVSILSTMKISELASQNPDLYQKDHEIILNYLKKIVHPNLKLKTESNLLFGSKIRVNALNRVQSTFRWEIVSEKLKNTYKNL